MEKVLPHASLGGKSPFEMRFGKKSDMTQLRLWGCKCYYKPPVEKVQKVARFDQTVQEGIFVGYDSISKDTPIIFDPKTETICLTHSVVYFESDPDVTVALDPKFMSHIDDIDDENKDVEMSDLNFDFSNNTSTDDKNIIDNFEAPTRVPAIVIDNENLNLKNNIESVPAQESDISNNKRVPAQESDNTIINSVPAQGLGNNSNVQKKINYYLK